MHASYGIFEERACISRASEVKANPRVTKPRPRGVWVGPLLRGLRVAGSVWWHALIPSADCGFRASPVIDTLDFTCPSPAWATFSILASLAIRCRPSQSCRISRASYQRMSNWLGVFVFKTPAAQSPSPKSIIYQCSAHPLLSVGFQTLWP